MAEKPLRRDPNRAPTHPGALLREDVLPAIGETVVAVARKLGVTRRHLHRAPTSRPASKSNSPLSGAFGEPGTRAGLFRYPADTSAHRGISHEYAQPRQDG